MSRSLYTYLATVTLTGDQMVFLGLELERSYELGSSVKVASYWMYRINKVFPSTWRGQIRTHRVWGVASSWRRVHLPRRIYGRQAQLLSPGAFLNLDLMNLRTNLRLTRYSQSHSDQWNLLLFRCKPWFSTSVSNFCQQSLPATSVTDLSPYLTGHS